MSREVCSFLPLNQTVNRSIPSTNSRTDWSRRKTCRQQSKLDCEFYLLLARAKTSTPASSCPHCTKSQRLLTACIYRNQNHDTRLATGTPSPTRAASHQHQANDQLPEKQALEAPPTNCSSKNSRDITYFRGTRVGTACPPNTETKQKNTICPVQKEQITTPSRRPCSSLEMEEMAPTLSNRRRHTSSPFPECPKNRQPKMSVLKAALTPCYEQKDAFLLYD